MAKQKGQSEIKCDSIKTVAIASHDKATKHKEPMKTQRKCT